MAGEVNPDSLSVATTQGVDPRHQPARTSAGGLRRGVRGPFPRLALASGAILLLGSSGALALVEPDPTPLDALVHPHAWILEQSHQPDALHETEIVAAVDAFRARAGGTWKTPIDLRTGRALLFQGTGLPMIPGAGNSLKPSDMPLGVLDSSGVATLAGIESLARGFFSENASLFLPERGDLVLNPNRSGILDEGRVAFADFDWFVDGVPVVGSRVFVRINNGNLIQAGTSLVGKIDSPTIPRLKASDAMDAVFAYAGLAAGGQTIVKEGRLVLLPTADQSSSYAGPVGAGLYYRLVWEVAFRQPDQPQTWTARVDALSGEVLEFYDANMYAGQITGGVYPRTVTDPETVWPFPFTDVVGGGAVTADFGGRFPFVTAEVSSGLDGRYFDTNCVSCGGPAQPSVSATMGAGLLRLGKGGLDQAGNGTSTRADRNSFYHLNIVRLVAKKWLSVSYLETPLPSNVNIISSCNAYYDGSSVNFYRSSAACNNTGEISDVMQHEWGHGLDFGTAGGDGATSEATGDTTGVHVTHSPLLGPYFHRDGSPVRNLDKNTTSKGLLTTANVTSKCSPGSGPLGREVHCEGEIYGQTTWDLATALLFKYGTNTGWRESEHLYFTSLPQSVIYLPDQAGSIYDAYLAVDDDDGNLGNGTPNASQIFTAFNTHLIASNAGFPPIESPHCARPAQPVVTATAGCDQIGLSWAAVPGATSYRIQKTWSTVPSPFLNVATTSGTSYTDTDVTAGVTYHYVVQAVNASSCESVITTETLASPTSRPRLEASAVVVDDTPAGNRSGGIDPGESVDLTVTFDNAGSSVASAPAATLATTTPGVTVTNATASYPNIAANDSAAGTSAYRIALSGSVPCGTPINLTLTPTAQGNSCPLEVNGLRLDTGVRTVVVSDSFEANSGWAHDVATSTAGTGAWVRGDPVATNFQPGGDASPSGSNCWYTATNASGTDDSNDVDGGQVVLLSPVMNLSGLPNARVTYWRWFGQRDLGDDPGDFYAFEVSNNGGSSWSVLENLGDNVNAAIWTKKEFTLNTMIPLTSTMRFRVRVADAVRAGDTGDIIEAAIDDFSITSYSCDLTPPCFTSPTFSGLTSVASAGAACGQVDLNWSAASTNCQNATMSYTIYRGTSPGFTPSPSNRVASNVSALTYRDSLFSAGTTYYYIVRANDSRSGEDANMVTRSVVAPGGPDASPPVFQGVVTTASGGSCGETLVSWGAGQDCTLPVRYRIYRSEDPNFTPSPFNLIGETTGTTWVDAALTPNADYTYIVRARDDSGNEETNVVRSSAIATVQPRTVYHFDFESGSAGFTVGLTNATSGVWALGDPVGTGAQPEDDTTPGAGHVCWATGLAGGGIGDNDVDGGYTTLVSPNLNLGAVVDPIIRYQRWYSNDLGPDPGADSFFIEVSNDGGQSYSFFDTTSQSTNGWQQRELALTPLITPTSTTRFQFVAIDQPEADSVVEAAIDDFDVIEPTGGCTGCLAQGPVGRILLTKSGSDVLLNWTSDPVSATRYVVYRASGAAFDQLLRLGTTASKSFTHTGASNIPGPIYYFVSAVNACGGESAYNTP